jgi:hypothetical protein
LNTVLLKLDPLVSPYRGLLQQYSKKSETETQEAWMMVDFVEKHLQKLDKELAKKIGVSTMMRIEFSKSQSSDYSIGALEDTSVTLP